MKNLVITLIISFGLTVALIAALYLFVQVALFFGPLGVAFTTMFLVIFMVVSIVMSENK